MEITIAVPRTKLFSGADRKTDKKGRSSAARGEAGRNKDIVELSSNAYKSLESRESKSQMKYELFERKNAMKLEAAAIMTGSVGNDREKSEGDIVSDTCRAMKAASDVSAGRPVSRKDLQLLLKIDPDLYFMVMMSANTPDIVDDEEEAVGENGGSGDVGECSGAEEASGAGEASDAAEAAVTEAETAEASVTEAI